MQTAFEQKFALPVGLSDVDTHATVDARPRRHLARILLVQHGGGTMAAFQTSHVIEMASHGHAVVTMEHPHESLLIEEADGLPRTEVLTAGLDRPLGLIIGNEAPAEAYQPFLDVLRGPHPFRQLQVMHHGFTTSWCSTPRRRPPRRSCRPGVSDDPAAGRRAMAEQRRFLRHVLSLR